MAFGITDILPLTLCQSWVTFIIHIIIYLSFRCQVMSVWMLSIVTRFRFRSNRHSFLLFLHSRWRPTSSPSARVPATQAISTTTKRSRFESRPRKSAQRSSRSSRRRRHRRRGRRPRQQQQQHCPATTCTPHHTPSANNWICIVFFF